ncbi:DUF6868 family protein [Neptunomonas japonica]|uniref:DUF6868 domain-containing protein n=1 Tax=Neptunomonas japonica JAMM 1380 TaxID=1441457 RepID=A0A7R6SVS7_9GAMM|nr:conserved hypothetical protein [Neptunomonas japonica JAMM 1380]
MDIETLKDFFMWCSVINVALLILWTSIFMLAPDFVYHTQRHFFAITRQQFDIAFYAFLGLFKLLFIIFSLVPYLTLLILT